MMLFPVYIKIYVAIVLVYIWYRFLLRFFAELRKEKTYPPYEARCSIIVPVYNEDSARLKQCVKSLVDAEGDNQIIIVDDHSKDCWPTIQELKVEYPQIEILRLEKNMGKRHAQYNALGIVDGDFIITVDSDTIVDKKAFVELIRPFHNPKIGATTGNVRALNRTENILTRMIDARYLNAFSFERQSLSSFGIVTCCSGVLSAYRRKIIDEIKDKYITQEWLGQKCTYGDDRYLTNMVLEKRWEVHYVNSSVAYTDVPNNFKQYVVQQLRWKKSFLRESLITLSHSIKHNWLLFFESLINVIIPYFSIAARIMLLYVIITHPAAIIPIAISILFVALLRNIILLFEEGFIALYSLPYAFIHEFCIYWLYWYALFRIRDTAWGTR
ncbi:glycosyltransferase [Candidatus Woesearchaeota archaeon]|nr:glycosyltransferase [Candidatus Woesearchaeota archaeon]